MQSFTSVFLSRSENEPALCFRRRQLRRRQVGQCAQLVAHGLEADMWWGRAWRITAPIRRDADRGRRRAACGNLRFCAGDIFRHAAGALRRIANRLPARLPDSTAGPYDLPSNLEEAGTLCGRHRPSLMPAVVLSNGQPPRRSGSTAIPADFAPVKFGSSISPTAPFRAARRPVAVWPGDASDRVPAGYAARAIFRRNGPSPTRSMLTLSSRGRSRAAGNPGGDHRLHVAPPPVRYSARLTTSRIPTK